MNGTLGSMPMMECPSCGHDWQWDDYYNIQEGDERECPYCEAIAVVTEKDLVMWCRLKPKGKP